MFPLGEHQQHLLIRRQTGPQPVEAQPLGHALGDVCAVASGQQDARDPLAAQTVQHGTRSLAQRVGHDEVPGHVTVNCHCDKDRSGALGGVIGHHPPDPGRHEAVAADDHLAALHTPQDPFARDLSHFCRNGQREALCLGGGDDGLRDRVLGGLIECGRKAQDVVLGHAILAVDRDDLRTAVGQRAGLVEDQGADARHCLERPCALDQHAKMRRARQTRDQCDRHGKDQRTGRGDHQHGDRADRIACEPPGREGDTDGDDQKAQRPAVGQPGHRRFGRLRFLD